MGMILFFLILLFLWQGTYWIGVDVLEIFKSYSVPSPLGVGRCFLELMQDGSLLQATLNSLFRGILGYAIAVLIGVALGVSLYHFKYLQRNMKPIILGIQTCLLYTSDAADE